MAPIATTPDLSQSKAAPGTVRKSFGDYKEQAAGAQTYDRKLEEEGDIDRPKATVLSTKM